MTSLNDIKRVIAKGKSEDIIKKFIIQYLIEKQEQEWLEEYEKGLEVLDESEQEQGEEEKEGIQTFNEWKESKGKVYEASESEINNVLNSLWKERRQAAYGDWESQLDEIYHDYEAWKARVTKVKTDIPKVD